MLKAQLILYKEAGLQPETFITARLPLFGKNIPLQFAVAEALLP